MRPAVAVTAAATLLAGLGYAAASVPAASARPLAPSSGRPWAAPDVTRGALVAVTGATLVCPDVGSAALLRVTTATPGPGSVHLLRVPVASAARAAGVAAATVSLPALGAVAGATGARVDAVRVDGPVVVRADGGVAAGLRATVSGSAVGAAACTTPVPDGWLVGPATVGDDPWLLLVNPGDGVATANLTVLTPTGPQSPSSLQGLEVAARSALRLRLADLAPEAAATAVRVRVLGGRLVGSIGAAGGGGSAIAGAVASAPAAVALTVPGSPGATARRLVLGVPGDVDATVRVVVTGLRGRTTPTALAAVTVPGGSVRALDLAGLAGPAMLQVSSTDGSPVVAGLRVEAGGAGRRRVDVWLPAVDGRAAPGVGPVVALDPTPSGPGGATLVLAPGGVPQTVTVTGVRADGFAAGSRRLGLAADHVAQLPLVGLLTPGGSVVVRGSAALAAAVVRTGSDGGLLGGYALSPVRAEVTVPSVREDPSG